MVGEVSRSPFSSLANSITFTQDLFCLSHSSLAHHNIYFNHDILLLRLYQNLKYTNYDSIILSYVVVRLFLMAEMFRSLFFLPPDAFMSSWPSTIPHIG
jgi:hypothetical protein